MFRGLRRCIREGAQPNFAPYQTVLRVDSAATRHSSPPHMLLLCQAVPYRYLKAFGGRLKGITAGRMRMRGRFIGGVSLLLFGVIAGLWLGGGALKLEESATQRVSPQESTKAQATAVPPLRDLGPRKYMRVLRDSTSRGIRALQTSLVEFRPSPGSKFETLLGRAGSITLIGAVHIGERGYYDELNREFRQYSRVLYELVAPRGVRPRPDRTSENGGLLAAFQRLLTDYFGMVHQIDAIDYSHRNFIHADLSPEEILAEGKRRGETMMSLGIGILGDMFRAYGKMNQLGVPTPNPTNTGPKALLAQFAEVMERTGGEGLGGTLEPYIIDIRNEEALRVLAKELISGAKSIAIFYGAAHLPKFEESLRTRFGLVPVRERWLTAWNLG